MLTLQLIEKFILCENGEQLEVLNIDANWLLNIFVKEIYSEVAFSDKVRSKNRSIITYITIANVRYTSYIMEKYQ